jgi:gamma-glutamyltranspeptidase
MNYCKALSGNLKALFLPEVAGVGLCILKKGVNTVDAAIETDFPLTVVESCMCSISGCGN